MLRASFNVGRGLIRNHQWRSVCQSVLRASQEAARLDEQSSTVYNNKKEVEGQGLTPDNPYSVASPTTKCIVGCSCEPESHAINWFYVTEGEPQTCNCGYYFKLEKVDPSTTWVPEYSRIMYVDETRVDPRLQKREGIFQKLFSKSKRQVKPPASMAKTLNRTKSDS